jgi:hypothetical protein
VESPTDGARKANKSPMLELKEFLSTPEKPVSSNEFREFWASCSREEKDDFIAQVGLRPTP